jgi:hypothetical protein
MRSPAAGASSVPPFLGPSTRRSSRGIRPGPARRTQPLRQVHGLVVPMQLPREALATLGEHMHLTRDQLVEVGILEPTEVAIDDEAAGCQTEKAQERPVPLDRDTSRQGVGHTVANLRVVGGQQRRHVGHQQTLPVSRSPTCPGAEGHPEHWPTQESLARAG